MKNIDFLPSRYREGYAARAAVIARWTIVLGLAVIITPLAIFQYVVHANVVQQFVLVEPEYMQALAKSKHLAELQQEADLVGGEAALLAWLAHPWPRSQILAHIHAPLPESVRLTAIRLAVEPKLAANVGGPTNRNRAARRNSDANEPLVDDSRPAHEKDLQQLLDQMQQNDSVVLLTGVTVSNTELHTYVARLRLSKMFAKSELRSLEAVPGQDSGKSQAFEIRLVLSPGHGEVPSAAPAAEASTSIAIMPANLHLARTP
jgi:hypothetical protein